MGRRKPNVWVRWGAGLLTFMGSGEANADQLISPPPAKVASVPKDDVAAHIKIVRARLGHCRSDDSAINDFIEKLNDPNKEEQKKAKEALDKKIAVLIKQLNDFDYHKREVASKALEQISSLAREQLLPVSRREPYREQEKRAQHILNQAKNIDLSTANELLPHIKALGKLGRPRAREVSSLLIEALEKNLPLPENDNTPNIVLRETALAALCELKEESAIPELLRLFENNSDVHFKGAIAISLTKMFSFAGPANCALIKEQLIPFFNYFIIKERKPIRQLAALEYQAAIRSEAQDVPDLIRELEFSGNMWEKYAATVALVHAAKAKDQWHLLVPALSRALIKESDLDVRRTCPEGLKVIACAAKSAEERALIREHAIPALIKGLDDPSMSVKKFSAIALGEIGSDAKDAIPALKELHDKAIKDQGLKFACKKAIAAILDKERTP